jgi:hypothetical protein
MARHWCLEFKYKYLFVRDCHQVIFRKSYVYVPFIIIFFQFKTEDKYLVSIYVVHTRVCIYASKHACVCTYVCMYCVFACMYVFVCCIYA